MVNLILVSHSYTLAQGVAELAQQMNNGCQIAVAAGMSDPENALGTDAVKIMMAIEEVYSPDGVLILMDLGSAILSAETALELIDPEMAANVKLCAAPLVEGTLAAVVSASAGADITTVVKEAEAALGVKRSQLGVGEQQGGTLHKNFASEPPHNALTFSWKVQNPHGLHIRPVAKLVEVLSPFQAKIWIEKEGKFADAKSYNQVMQLQIRHNHVIQFYLSGVDEIQALKALQDLANQHFGEPLKAEVSNEKIYGVAVLAHISTGQAVTFHQHFVSPVTKLETDFETKQQQVKSAFSQTQQQLAELVNSPQLNADFAGVFQAHQLLLDEVQDEVFALLADYSAEAACECVFSTMKRQYQQLDDPYLQARALDVDDLCYRVLHNLYGLEIVLPQLSANRILVAEELYPSILARLLEEPLQGICLQQGNRYSHTALLAQSVHIPLLIECGEALAEIAYGDELQVNWSEGIITKIQ